MHTPNPHSDFPMRPPLIEVEETALDRIFSALLPELHLHFGWSRHRYEDEGIEHWSTLHWVWAEGIGVPLWPPTTGGMHSLRLPSAKETLR